MDEARMDELGRRFLLSDQLEDDACDSLAIQELIFLLQSVRHLKEKESFAAEHLDARSELFLQVLQRKVREAEGVYLAYDSHTNYPYLDSEDRVWLFSDEAYAGHAKDYYMQQLVLLEMKRVEHADIGRMLGELHLLGIPRILLDNGQRTIVLERDDLLPPPDWSNTPAINIPLSNPKLQLALLRFFQGMYSRQEYEGKQQFLRTAEAQMLDEVVRAKYLVPMRMQESEPAVPDAAGKMTLKQGTVLQFAALEAEDGQSWLPVFTDWPEFEKGYDKSVWGGNIVAYEDILTLSKDMVGAVINFRGIGFRLNDPNKAMIAEYLKERDAAK